MSKKRIFVLNGHPAETSLNRSLAEQYAEAAQAAGHDVRLTHIHDLDFDMDYGFAGYVNQKPLEQSLEQVALNIEWCEHFVVVAPMWWGGLPAKLKGLFDRTLLPGRAFNTRETTLMGLPKPMLTGRTGRMVITSDTPRWALAVLYKSAMIHQLRGQILKFVGITPAKLTYFGGASHPKAGNADKWLQAVKNLGQQGA